MTFVARVALRSIPSMLIFLSLVSCGETPVEPEPIGGSPSEELLYYEPGRGLFVLDIRTGEVTQVTSGSIRVRAVQWSPDGERIAFSARDDTSPFAAADLFVVDPDGANLRRITQTPLFEDDPIWSPDGSRLLYQRFENVENGSGRELMVVDVNGGTPRRVVAELGVGGGFTWSPDGQRIGFIAGCSRAAPCLQGETSNEIFVIRADGTEVRRLTDDAIQVQGLRWSPTGERLVYIESPLSGGDTEIFTIRADGSSRRPITNNSSYEHTPVWAPGGERIAFHGFSTGASAIHVIRVDGSDEVILDNPETTFEFGPSWNPDGERIAFTACLDLEEGDCRGPGDYSVDLFVTDADGSNLQQITDTPQVELLVGWRP